MIRKGRKYTSEEILPLVEFRNNPSRKELDGDRINFSSLRLQTFAAKGTACVRCGIEGEWFIKEKHHPSDKFFTLSFYAVDGFGKEILMTKDHIIPKSKGGRDQLSNLNPMCYICNQDKGSDPWTFNSKS